MMPIWLGVLIAVSAAVVFVVIWGFAWKRIWKFVDRRKPIGGPKYGLMQTLTKEQADEYRRGKPIARGEDVFLPEVNDCMTVFRAERERTKAQKHSPSPPWSRSHVCGPASSPIWTCACEERGYSAALRKLSE
jgi:hypothetical protein